MHWKTRQRNKTRNRKPPRVKRAERIHRRATTVEIEDIIEYNLSEEVALRIHRQRVKKWFGSQNNITEEKIKNLCRLVLVQE